MQVNNVFNSPLQRGDECWIAYPHPQVIFKYDLRGSSDMKNVIIPLLGLLLFPVQPTHAQTLTARLDVKTDSSQSVNNALLGYNILHFKSSRDLDFVKRMDPVAMRFPDGVWGNFYDWETDSFTNHGDSHRRTNVYAPTLAKWKELGIKGGFDGLTKLNNDKKQKDGKGYDIIWLYNAAYDSPSKNVARMKDSIKKGFVVRDIELGNEQFWLSQCSSKTITSEGYLDSAQGIAKALKRANPEVRVSVTLSWRDRHDSWNKIVSDNGSYFDAISLHKYSGFDNDKPENQAGLKAVLAGRLRLAESAAYVRSFAKKPIWLSEWGLNAGTGAKATSALTMADCYLYLFENQDIFDRANWFSVNGVSRSFMVMGKNRRPVQPLKKTAYGCVHEIMRSIFEDAKLLPSVTSTKKLDTGAGTIATVTARAVNNDGRIIVCAVNLSDQPCRFSLVIDKKPHTGPFVHEAMAFDSLDDLVLVDFEQSPLKKIEPATRGIILPPLSVNKIEVIE